MSIRNLDKIFRPKRIAVVGVGEGTQSPCSAVLRNLLVEGCEHIVYPVIPQGESIHGLQAYRDIDQLPQLPDVAVICTEAHEVADTVTRCGKAGIEGLIILSNGFREVGQQGAAREQQVIEAARQYPAMRILGPNCSGVVVPRQKLNISCSAGMPKEGNLAFVSQSKAICASTIDWALKEQIGFSYFVSTGNSIDVNISDLIDFFGNDPRTLGLILYVLSIDDVREFMSAARAFSRSKPIVAYKSGRYVEAEAMAFHTGVMVGEDDVYDAAFERAGIVRVSGVDDLFDCAGLLAHQLPPRGKSLAIISNAGEPAAVAADALLAYHGELTTPSQETLRQITPLLQVNRPPGNPVHLRRNATAEEYARATSLVLNDLHVKAALVILTPREATHATRIAQAVSEVAAESPKPVLAAWMGGLRVQEGIAALNRRGVPAYNSPEQAIRAFNYLVSYGRNKETLYETPLDVPIESGQLRERVKQFWQQRQPEHELMTEYDSKALLQSCGIPVAEVEIARSADEAVHVARRIGYPVVLKILSPDITHKTDVAGVALNLTTEIGVRAHFTQIMERAKELCPHAQLQGVTVQRMVVAPNGIELILGTKMDHTFGATIMVGMGGTTTEIVRDRALGLPPLNEQLARHMLMSLTAWPLLLGYRGKPAVDIDRLIEIVIRLSYLAADCPQIKELDINPLLVTPSDAVALDARIRLAKADNSEDTRPFAHVAIRPYPEEYVTSASLHNGTTVVLRPIRPEDEKRWQALLARCSDESIHQRFHALLKRTSHEVATRYCFIDYDREMAIVAETTVDQTSEIIGVANLFSDPNRESAEYAMLVADDWQGNGLGEHLASHCISIAQDWRLKDVRAETTIVNAQTLKILTKQGFEITHRRDDGVMLLRKILV